MIDNQLICCLCLKLTTLNYDFFHQQTRFIVFVLGLKPHHICNVLIDKQKKTYSRA